MADKILGVNLATTFKNRNDFSSDSEYQYYIMTNLRPNILCCARKTQRGTWSPTKEPLVGFDLSGPLVKWTTGNTVTVSFLDLNILTPPVNIVPLAEIL